MSLAVQSGDGMTSAGHKATVQVGTGGAPQAVLWRGEMKAVRRVLDRWRFELEWAKADQGREYFDLELTDGTRLELCHHLNKGEWVIQQAKEPWFRFLTRALAKQG